MPTPSSQRSAPARGFTLVELLVVIGIIAVLATLVGVVVSKARGTADKFRLGAQLQAIAVGLDAYKTDFAAYPATLIENGVVNDGDEQTNADGFRGARSLCKALMGQCAQGPLTSATPTTGTFLLSRSDQDGIDGFGFRIPPRSGVFLIDQADPAPPATRTKLAGKVYGPYLNVDKFKVVNVATINGTIVNGKTYNIGDQIAGNAYDDRAVLLDANDSPVLYYPCLNPQATVSRAIATTSTPAYSYVGVGHQTNDPSSSLEPASTAAAATTFGGTPMYRSTDNGYWLPTPTLRKQLGDVNSDGVIDLSLNERPAVVGKYILWSAGPDKVFGPDLKGAVDDVTNFQGE